MNDPAAAVDAVVVTRNTRELTLRCVGAIVAADGADGLRVQCTVIDNASTDGTADAIEARWSQVRVIRNTVNAGYGEACNQGLRDGSGDYVLILNSDVIAREGAIARLIGFLATSRGHVAAGGRLVDPGTDHPQVGHNVRAFPRLSTQVALLLGLERYWPDNPVSRHARGLDIDYELTQDVAQPAGACLACRRADFDAIGGFDEAFYYWYEDVDLVRRLADRGRIAYVHDATFEHVGGATFDQWVRTQRMSSWYLGVIRYFAKHRPRWEQLVIRMLIAMLAAVRMVAWAPRDRARSRAGLEVLKLAVAGDGGG